MDVPDRYSQCTRKFCNLWQDAEERRQKYAYCRALGVSSYMAQRLRDWQWQTIDKYFEYSEAYQRFMKERKEEGKCLTGPASS